MIALRRYEVFPLFPLSPFAPTRHFSFRGARRAARQRGRQIFDRRRNQTILARAGWVARKPLFDHGAACS
jgi:hypothetical protein